MASAQGAGNFEDTVELVLGGTKTALTVEKVNGLVGMYMVSGASGDTVPFKIAGRLVGAPKNSTSEAWTAGQSLYWDASNNYFTTTQNGTPVCAVVAAAAGSSATQGDVILLQLADLSSDLVPITVQTTANSVDVDIFVADRACRVISVRESHSVVGGAAAAVRPRKITDTSAPGAGAGATVKELTTASIDLTATINTVVSPALSATASDLILAAGNRIALDFSGTLTGLVGQITILIQYL